jgi:hypothetical protein
MSWGVASKAHAGNAARPRVPPSFLGGQCLVDVDRSADPVLSMPVGIPFEDIDLTEDEPVDSRTFQFFAMCRELPPLQELPVWIDAEDADRAIVADPSIAPPDPANVLASDPNWSECAHPITAETDRIPISCEATADGAIWDTTDAAAGTYVVWGYTFEPPTNLWTPRPGIVRVHDGDPDAVGPAVAFTYPTADVNVTLEGGIRLEGCAAGAEGTSIELAWATAKALDAEGDSAWHPFDDRPVDDGVLEIDFMPPDELLYQAVFFRAVATDPQGRSWTTYTSAPAVFLEGCKDPRGGRTPKVDDCGGGVEPEPDGRNATSCDGTDPEPEDDGEPDDGGSTGEPEPEATTGDGEDEDDPAAADDPATGGGCNLGPRPSRWSWACIPLLALLRRRNSRTRTVNRCALDRCGPRDVRSRGLATSGDRPLRRPMVGRRCRRGRRGDP